MDGSQINKAIADAALADEFRTVEGAVAAEYPCPKKCTQCEGPDHHWMCECPEDGSPLMVCKHCPAWREMRDDDELE